MTAEKQYVDDFESAYQGKTWTMGKMSVIMLIVAVTMALRDIGMMMIYGSIYDKIALEGIGTGISFMNYVFMVLLYILPLIYPMVLRFTNGAYDNEIEGSLLPSFNKKSVTVIVYAAVALVMVAPIILFMVGVFTTAYMFVAVNLALLLFTSVTIFYYFGTYMLQRARMSLAKKYVFPTAMMIVTSLASFVIAVGAVVAIYFAGVDVSLIVHMTRFLENWDIVELIVMAVVMFATVVIANVAAGFIYNLTQNIIYSATPTFIFAYSNIIIIQRIREASKYLATAETSLAEYQKKLAAATDSKNISNYKAKIAELEANIPLEEVGIIISYVIMTISVLALIGLCVYAVYGLKKNLKDAK